MDVTHIENTIQSSVFELMSTEGLHTALDVHGNTGDESWPNELLTLLQERNWTSLATRLSELAPEAHNSAQRNLLHRFIECLPDEILGAHPRVTAWWGALLISIDLPAALVAWEKSYQSFAHERNWNGLAMVVAGVLQAILADAREFERLDLWLERASAIVGQRRGIMPAIWLRFIAAFTLASCHRQPDCIYLTDYILALNHALRATDIDATQGLAAAGYALNASSWMADIANANELEVLAQQWMISTGADATAIYYINRIFHASIMDDIELAEHSYHAFMNLSQNVRVRSMHNAAKLNLAHAYANSGRWNEASNMLDDVQRSIKTGRAVDWSVHYVLRSWVALGQGNAAAGLDFSQHALHAAQAGGIRRMQAYALLAQATALADTGSVDAAYQAATMAKQMLAGLESPLVAFHAASVVAYALLKGHAPAQALDPLREAFNLGRRHRFFNTLLWVPHMMAQLCNCALQHAIEPEYVTEMVRQRKLQPCNKTSDAWPWRIKIYTLGTFRVLKDNIQITFKGKAQQRPLDLLKVLIAHGGRDAHTTRLADSLWSDSDADGAQNTFDSTLHRLRKLLDCDDALLLREGKLSLNANYCWLDTWSFEHDDHTHTLHAPTLPALNLYHGLFLANEAEQAWMIPYRERLHSRYLRAVRAVGTQLETEARWQDAIDLYERALEIDPSAEVVYVQLMRCYCQFGYRAEALNIYRRCRTTLAALFGLPPPPQVERLHQQIQKR